MSSSLNMPTEFGLSFFFRIAPGFLAAFLFLDTIGELNAVSLTDAITLVGILGLVLGLVLMLIRYPVWAFYEGRWFWPSRIREKMVSSLQKHLESSFMKAKSLQKKVDELSTKERLTADERKELDEARRKYKELWFGIRQFPEDRTGTWDVAPGIRVGMRKATAPTRFGNIVQEYETYPLLRYGMDTVFYWYRLVLLIPKDSYDMIDDASAAAESLMFTSVVFIAFAVFFAFFSQGYPDLFLRVSVVGSSLLLSYLVYRASLHPLRSYGENFKALFDAYRGELFR